MTLLNIIGGVWTCAAAGGGSAATSGLTAATSTNTIDNTNFAQSWNWSTATTENAMSIAANSITTGSLMNLTTSSAGVNSTNGLLNVANTSAATTGVLARFQSNSTAGSGLTVLANGNVGIGTTSPVAALHVVGSTGTAGSPNGVTGMTVAGGNGYASGNGNGGSINFTGGTASGTGTGGDINITSGVGVNASFTRAGNITIDHGNGWSQSSTTIKGGNYGGQGASYLTLSGAGSITTGAVVLSSGSPGTSGSIGTVTIQTPTSTYTNGSSAAINVTAGSGFQAGSGGVVNITAGGGGSTNVSGSNVVLNGGAKGGTANDGNVVMANLRGNVGIGVAGPTAKLDVAGQSRTTNSGGAANINASAAVNWNNGNAQSMSVDCATTTFTNMLDAGTYILAVSETGTSTCTFSQAGLTFYFSPANGARTSGQRTVYTFQRIGTDVYVSWVAGFQ